MRFEMEMESALKKTIVVLVSVFVLAAVFAVAERAAGQGALAVEEQAAVEPAVEFRTRMDKVSYAIGLDIGANLRMQKLDVNPEILSRGIADALAERPPLLSEAELGRVMQEFQQEYAAERQAEIQAMAAENLAAAEEFLSENKTNVGVETAESGLQYIVLEEGEGASPTAEDVVRVNYRGTLLDGTEFDSSYRRGQPAQFQVRGVIPGWQEALQMMKVGGKWRLFIPPDLAYGEAGAGQAIEPNSLLIFEVELLEIVEETGEESGAAAGR